MAQQVVYPVSKIEKTNINIPFNRQEDLPNWTVS